MNYVEIANKIQDIVRRAGSVIISYKKENVLSFYTEGTQVKAELDIIIHNFLVESLGQLFPSIPILSEESIDSVNVFKIKSSEYSIVIDPIDGTSSLVHNFPGYVIQLALLNYGLPVVSVVYAPEFDHMFYAIRGAGAFLNYRPLAVRENQDVIRVIDNYPEPIDSLKKIIGRMRQAEYIESGSIGLKICRVADGTADFFFKDVVIRDWDLLPPYLILLEAGGYISKLDGSEIDFFNNSEFVHHGLVAMADKNYIQYLKENTHV